MRQLRDCNFHELLARLELVSHAPTVNLSPTKGPSSDEDIGGKRPPGTDREHPDGSNLAEVSAFLDSYHRRTVGYYRRRVAKCETREQREALRLELVGTIEAWLRAPLPVGQEPEYGSPQWKRYVAESREDPGVLATRFFVTRRYINKVRQQYRQAA